MEKKLFKLIKSFKSLGLINNKIDKKLIEKHDNIEGILFELMPERFCTYDAESIDDPDSYYRIIEAHVDATLGALEISSLIITGNVEGKIIIQFEHNGSKFIWKINQNGSDFVDDGFIKKLNVFCKKYIYGEFFKFESIDQGFTFIYLPNKAVSLLKNHLKIVSVNYYPGLFSNESKCLEPICLAYERYGSEIIYTRNKHGETALTAAIKAKNEEKAIFGIESDLLVSRTQRNMDGKAPIQLAQEYNMPSIVSRLERFLGDYSSITWDEALLKSCSVFSQLVPEIIDKSYASDIFPRVYGMGLIIGRAPVFQSGNMTLEILEIDERERRHKSKAYTVIFNPEYDNGDGYVSNHLTKEEVLSCVHEFAILNFKYVKNEEHERAALQPPPPSWLCTFDEDSKADLLASNGVITTKVKYKGLDYIVWKYDDHEKVAVILEYEPWLIEEMKKGLIEEKKAKNTCQRCGCELKYGEEYIAPPYLSGATAKLNKLEKELRTTRALIEILASESGVNIDAVTEYVHHAMGYGCIERTRDCPVCGKKLRSWKAKVCFECGAGFDPLS